MHFVSKNNIQIVISIIRSKTVFQFLEEITNGISSKAYTSALVLDLFKAFNRVDHQTLLSKLGKVGFRGVAYD